MHVLCFYQVGLILKEWVVTKFSQKSKGPNSNLIYAIDCEMVLCEDGTENLVRVCMVDRDLQVCSWPLFLLVASVHTSLYTYSHVEKPWFHQYTNLYMML